MKVAGHLREKKGLYYAVIKYTAANGKRKEKWFPTKLPIRGNKKKAEEILRQVENDFKIPTIDLYLHDLSAKNICVSDNPAMKTIPEDILEKVSLSDLTDEQISNMLFADYLVKYLPLTRKRKKPIEDTTYAGYCSSVTSPIAPYFRERGITLGELEPEDIQDFYDVQLERVKANTVIHYHAIIRLAVCHARKKGYIKVNPIDEVNKPEKNDFVGKVLSDKELCDLFMAVKDTKLLIPVLFGGFYGLRRSEIVGLRWSAFDFDSNIFYVNHTVTTPRIDGKEMIIAKDRAKTKSSLRALPLDPDFKKILLGIKQRQESYQRKFKRSYSKEWLGYLAVDELGGLILPNYITTAFKRFLENNEFKVIRFHDLRHTCASILLNKGRESGLTMKDIQEFLGHSEIGTTFNTYAHLDANSKQMSVATISKSMLPALANI